MTSLDIREPSERPVAIPLARLSEQVEAIQAATTAGEALAAAVASLCRNLDLPAAIVYSNAGGGWQVSEPARDVYLSRPRKLAALRRWARAEGSAPKASAPASPPPAGTLGLAVWAETTLRVEGTPVYWLQFFAEAGSRVDRDLPPALRLLETAIELRLERDRARAAREASEQRFKNLAELTTGHYWEMDEQFRFTQLEGVEDYSVLPIGGEILGKTRWELAGADPDCDAKWRRHREDLMAHRPVDSFEYATSLNNDALRHWRVSGRPVFDAEGRFLGYRGVSVDTTAHKRAEVRLLESQDRFRRFAELTSDWLWEMDEDLRYTWVSERVLQGLGRPPEWYRGKTRQGIGHLEENPQGWRRHLDALHRREPYRDFTMRLDTPLGPRWVRSNGVPVFDDEGNFKGYVGTGVDITEIVEADQAANRAHALLEHAVEDLREMFSLWDADDRLVLGNAEFRQINAAVPEVTLPGTPFSEHLRAIIAAGLCPQAIGREEEWRRWRLARRAEPGGPFEMQRQDGCWTLVSEHRMPEGGTVTLATDITQLKGAEAELRRAQAELELRVAERTAALEAANRAMRQEIAERTRVAEALRESEAQLRLIADNLPVLITYNDRHQRLRFANKAAEGWIGRAAGEILGRSVAEIFGTSAHRQLAPSIKKVLAGEPVRHEHVLTYPDGVTRVVEVIYVPDFDEAQAVRGYIVLALDVTEQRASEAQLRQAQKMEAVGQLTGGIAHDFNNLLTVIQGSLELIALDLPPGCAAIRHAQAGLHAVAHGSLLTQHLLAFARKQALLPRPTDVNLLVASFAPILQRTLGEQIEVRIDLADDLWPATVDRAQLENVLLNLALNARDAMPGGGVLNIETGWDRISDESAAELDDVAAGAYVTLTIRDDGQGMSAEVLSHALEPFFTTKEVGKGSGLGLSMVFGFVKQSRGHMTVDSEPAVGTVVRLHLPRAEAVLSADEAAAPTAPVRGSGTILLVEDDPRVRGYATSQLAHLGYRVVAVADGDAALAALQAEESIDLLFTDVVLAGGISGPELAQAARRRRPGLKVLFTSGHGESTVLARGQLDPTSEFLPKPYSAANLARMIREALTDETV